MILLFRKHQKSIALFLLTLFYCDFVMAGAAGVWHGENAAKNFNRTNEFDSSVNNSTKSNDSFSFMESNSNEDNFFNQSDDKEKDFQTFDDSVNFFNQEDDEDFIGGPSQPEMQSFQSVNNNNMVDLFTGDFSYNIPLMDVGGYPINLSYRSGITMDQEASWVGLGWNVNPGTITRNLRGLPDDFNGVNDKITKKVSIKENKTVGISAGFTAAPEVGGHQLPFSFGINAGIFHNSYRGWGLDAGLNATINAGKGAKGPLSGGLSLSNNSQSGLTLAPSLSLKLFNQDAEDKGGLTGSLSTSFAYNSRTGIKSLDLSADIRQYIITEKNQKLNTGVGIPSSISFATPSYTPSITLPFTSTQYTLNAKVGNEAWGFFSNVFLGGYVSTQKIEDEDKSLTLPAYGYLNYQYANENPSALLDFNREKEIAYREDPPIPNIAVPNYTYDAFSISGEGTGGMFRAYRSDIGFVYDHYIKTKDQSAGFSAEVGLGNLLHIGVDLNLNSSYTENSRWISDNTLKEVIAFKQSDSTFKAAYFKNPGEKSISPKEFYADDVLTPNLYQYGTSSPNISLTNFFRRYDKATYLGNVLLTKEDALKNERDIRTQVITYLTAEEAGAAGLNKNIENYSPNLFGVKTCDKEFPANYGADTYEINDTVSIEKRVSSFRKPNHISEIDVLNPDGRRYIYGIPVYNLRQKEVSFSVNRSYANVSNGLVKWSSSIDTTVNNHVDNTDYYFTSEELPPYAHSYLLTGILSPDYVDLTGDGVSDDDLGDAVKFNYSKVAGLNNPFEWRTPYNDSASYSEGLRTSYKDDRGNYVYGKKELWYLHSIESKTMIAIFWVHDRSDLRSISESGVKSLHTAKKLDSIQLFSKPDFLKKGILARAIKTVHFRYDTAGTANELCKGLNGNAGKLTLRKIFFSYNGHVNKRPQNQYLFHYYSNNPNYNIKSYDRWGNYKDPSQNPGSLPNAEYPYTAQNNYSDSAAAAWTLDSMVLPSGGKMKITYESDDYAYVQNKRAMQLFKVAYLSNDSTGAEHYTLYNSVAEDNLYVFIKSDQQLYSRQDVYFKFLEGVEKIYFKLYVRMPDGSGASGYEYVPCYADLDKTLQDAGFGLKNDGHTFWVRLRGISLAGDEDGDYSPLAKAAIQFLRLNLPGKAYPGSEVGDNLGIKEFIQMIAAMADNIMYGFENFDVIARGKRWAAEIDTARAFIRLNNPYFNKCGGGLRVKSIKVYDNWNAMTSTNSSGPSNGQRESVYGKEYDYTTVKLINGIPAKISSGVASYEPMIGGEENPFRQPIRYVEKIAPRAPVTLGYTEEPLGESFFPAPGVGYSKVRVRSLNTKNRKSANGYEETTFYTAYDFPTITDNSLINEDTKKRYAPKLSNFLRINAKHYLALSQGFKIELNDMHGRMRSQATYPETDSSTAISYTENFYKEEEIGADFRHLKNTVTTINPSGEINEESIVGKDIELMVDMRQQQSITTGDNFGLNVDVFIAGIIPIPIPSYIPIPQSEENLFRSAAIVKVINRQGILDSVVHIEKGSIVSTKNLLYDSETGEILLTRTNNEFNEPVYNFTYPAHWAYNGMGLACKNIDAVFSGITIINGLPEPSDKYPRFKSFFESGDEILAIGREKTDDFADTTCSGIQTGCIMPVWAEDTTSKRIWAVDLRMIDTSLGQSIIFVQRDGTPYTATDVTVKIIRSGIRNLSSTPVGSVTCLNNPIQVKQSKLTLVLDSTAKVTTASASIHKEQWKVNNSLSDACLSLVTQHALNPYTTGIFGNWRLDKSYVYYDDRKEVDPNENTDIRKNGTIKSFTPFWFFHNDSLRISNDTSQWVWNSQATLFNKKGYELENKDALGRYNSGEYGYNYTLPVSVTQNSKYREQLFDGFEDYLYGAGNCAAPCALPRNIDFTQVGGTLDTDNRHSGKYSLKISAGDSAFITVPIVSSLYDTISQKIVAVTETTTRLDTMINRKGSGLKVTFGGCGSPPEANSYDGYLQTPKTGKYVISIAEDLQGCTLFGPRSCSYSIDGTSQPCSTPIEKNLIAGKLYSISIIADEGYFEHRPTVNLDLNNCDTSWGDTLRPSYLYSNDGDDSIGSFSRTRTVCTKSTDITTDSSSLLPSFLPTQGGKYWLSAWVKEEQDCLCENYTNNQVKFVIKNNSDNETVVVAKPSGNIIDGWQRYDKVVDIPSDAVSMAIKLKSTGSTAVNFDDLRIHPFNANMKSFVYDPVNLRLMAELDENNYATYYEYDDDGTLTRLKKETQRGIQTIKETRSYQIKN